jgi:hypothetical protein
LKFFKKTPLRGGDMFCYTMHPFARNGGRRSLKVELKARPISFSAKAAGEDLEGTRNTKECLCESIKQESLTGFKTQNLFLESLILAQNERW